MLTFRVVFLIVAGMSGQSLNSIIPESASDLSDGFELNIDLENLGVAEGRNQVYNVRTLSDTGMILHKQTGAESATC